MVLVGDYGDLGTDPSLEWYEVLVFMCDIGSSFIEYMSCL